MNSTHTGIAVALALAVIAAIFIFPGLSPFPMGASSQPAAVDTAITTNDQTGSATMPTESTDVQMSDVVVGKGAEAVVGDTVTVHYVGSLTNGTVFDASANHGDAGFTFKLGAGQVIQGWDIGVAGMKVGGKRNLVIPPGLAYGSQAVGGVIPANSTLMFEVELMKVQKGH